jgi:hypothetical protein
MNYTSVAERAIEAVNRLLVAAMTSAWTSTLNHQHVAPFQEDYGVDEDSEQHLCGRFGGAAALRASGVAAPSDQDASVSNDASNAVTSTVTLNGLRSERATGLRTCRSPSRPTLASPMDWSTLPPRRL